jgi:hypothetical protein
VPVAFETNRWSTDEGKLLVRTQLEIVKPLPEVVIVGTAM